MLTPEQKSEPSLAVIDPDGFNTIFIEPAYSGRLQCSLGFSGRCCHFQS